MTPAERSARYRATHQDGAPRIRYRRPADRRSKAQRWRDAVAELVELQEGIEQSDRHHQEDLRSLLGRKGGVSRAAKGADCKSAG